MGVRINVSGITVYVVGHNRMESNDRKRRDDAERGERRGALKALVALVRNGTLDADTAAHNAKELYGMSEKRFRALLSGIPEKKE